MILAQESMRIHLNGEQSYCGDPKAIISSRKYANSAENNIVIEECIDWNGNDSSDDIEDDTPII